MLARLIDRWLKWWRPTRIEPDPALTQTLKDTFAGLLAREGQGLRRTTGWSGTAPAIEVPASGEPWVAKTSTNYVGLALSGGGIRSATFNLGLLQGLERLELLSTVAYLSTVSGGGYIGGFWSAWLARGAPPPAPNRPESANPQFPGGGVAKDDPSRVEDTPDVRHLREFSRFLAPRVGFFETEMWHAVLAFAGGLIPTLVVTWSLIALSLAAFLGLTTYLANDRLICGLSLTVALAAILLERLERSWSLTADPEAIDAGLRANFVFALIGLTVSGLTFWAVDWYFDSLVAAGAASVQTGATWILQTGSWAAWREGVFLAPQGADGLRVYLRVFEPAAAWSLAGLTLLVARLFVRGLSPRARRGVRSNALDRVIMRLLGMAMVWAVAGSLWHLGALASRAGWADAWTALAAALSGGLFSIFRNWLTTAFKQTGHRGFLERARPFLPMLLAYLTIGLGIVWVASVMASFLAGGDIAGDPRPAVEWLLPWVVGLLVTAGTLGVMLSLDPSDYSLHAFYRERIARAYLGATNPEARDRAADNRNAEFRRDDDLLLSALKDRPVHLVCCAANDLSGDQVETLARGSRSVTLSKHGIAMGGLWAPPDPITLGAALTASAAAFNSAMGSVSKKLGPAVTFLMTALNLRLGLWVRHPKQVEEPSELPGRSLLRELFGRTHAGLFRDGRPEAPVLHLSDGAHFDNLGLYELIRRHCRYIIVSDCGADNQIKFDDLGNAVRRIREDFGVEIEIDLRPIRPTPDRPATQHAVVGTIHYDRHFDKGVIVYFKPTLVGDEPPDVLQYRLRNTAFPHEGTIDQFYDEAQWESYRRLGFHSALVFFNFAERLDNPRADEIFTGARQEWFPTPDRLKDRILESTARFGSIEQEIREGGQTRLLAELFPEVALPPAPARCNLESVEAF
jgi:hypothetical protein